ncbi:RNA polymerase sigma factor [Plebeiibacterium sediminum]|uniref:Sigma-70 family RNA polymerase sigma factor n=1 Tax=Plebeiibacterium sediminum TaxID=2992112 RepID=A0AAE3M5V8_9BACT|nr:sigma-70 family RNA polymerase sigma factor [Plebeiobacterium sediminum]MCW3787180.1 sigma-70 family RNA polymerase sigma factor [Plebeiobacterium sediminum]
MRLFQLNRKTKSDAELVNLYQESHNLDILGELYGRYMDLVFGVSLKYLKNNSEAQDAVIQIFEKISSSLKDSKIEHFRPWLYVVTKNHCLMELRKEKHNTISLDDEKSFIGNFMESEYETHPIDEELHQQNEEALKNCINKLKFQQKESIELFYFKEMTYQQISIKMETDIKKVKSYIQNAKRNLKICLEKSNAI